MTAPDDAQPAAANLTEIDRAAAILRAGGLVAFPTETVYGLGADAVNREAIGRLFAVKRRPASHPLIVHLAETAWLSEWARDVPEQARLLAQRFWPGPLTIILRRGSRVPDEVTGGQDTVGLRVPAHPVARALLARFGGGIAAPSANRFGRVSPTLAEHVRMDLGDDVDLVLDGGPTEVGIESTIIDLSRGTPALLRPGWITPAAIEAVLGRTVTRADKDGPRAPGTLDAHYAPETRVELVGSDDIADRARAGNVALLAFEPPARDVEVRAFVRAPRDAATYTHALYATLRELDRAGADVILVESPPEADEWSGVLDRLRRATSR